MDWSIKLWNPNVQSSPLYSFESSNDWVYDVQWSPKHPAVFASVDNGGHVNIWNINQNKESPVVRGLPHLKTS
jgi:dynein intermediate chain, cytosolic